MKSPALGPKLKGRKSNVTRSGMESLGFRVRIDGPAKMEQLFAGLPSRFYETSGPITACRTGVYKVSYGGLQRF